MWRIERKTCKGVGTARIATPLPLWLLGETEGKKNKGKKKLKYRRLLGKWQSIIHDSGFFFLSFNHSYKLIMVLTWIKHYNMYSLDWDNIYHEWNFDKKFYLFTFFTIRLLWLIYETK